jgi:hypothetical protein
VNNRYRSGIASEHAYRGDLEALIRELVPQVEVTNEPSKVTECGNPDYVITRKNIPIGFIEAKDIGKDLKSKTYKEQFERYRKALDNLADVFRATDVKALLKNFGIATSSTSSKVIIIR